MPAKDQDSRDDYLLIFNTILEGQKKLLGQNVALKYARKTPLQINPEGELEDFYGEGKSVLEIVVSQYESVWGKKVADRKIGRSLKKKLPEEKHDLLTEELRNVQPRKSAISQLKQKILG